MKTLQFLYKLTKTSTINQVTRSS